MTPARSLLVATTGFPTLDPAHPSTSGTEQAYLLREVQTLAAAGFRVTVLSPLLKGLPSHETREALTAKRFTYPLMLSNPGYSTYPLYSAKSALERMSLPALAVGFHFNILRELRHNDYDLIWANWLQVGTLCALANYKRLPLLVTLRGSDIRLFPAPVVRALARLTPDVLNMYQADLELAGWIKRFKFRSWPVPAPYVLAPIPRAAGSTKTITVIGRLDGSPFAELKGLGMSTFSALADLLATRDDFRVVVIGSGRRLNYYRAMLDHFGDRVHFTGWLREFSAYLGTAYLVIGAAATNGVVMDAVPNGVPVLIPNAMRGVFWEDGCNCVTYDATNPSAFRRSIEYALDNPDALLRFATRARQQLVEYALPIDKAAVEWRRTIDEFLTPRRLTCSS